MHGDGSTIFQQLAVAVASDWRGQARPEQLPPPGDWFAWLILAGRGWGKTRTGSEWVQALATSRPCRIALVAPTAADARDVMVEGESGLLSIAPAWARPNFESSKRRLTWPNGSTATLFSSEEPERLRGPQFHGAWADELCAWTHLEQCFDQLAFGLRLGQAPQMVITTTPRPSRVLSALMQREGVVVTRGRTAENALNLAPQFLTEIVARYQGTRLGRQELDAEVLTDSPGALWCALTIDANRVAVAPDDLHRVVIAIDPAASMSEDADETGLIVAALKGDRVFVLGDWSGRFSPHEWASRAIAAFDEFHADKIVAEVNNGGAMVTHTLRTVRPTIPIKQIHATRGKILRAEPVAALYEQNRVSHVGQLDALEDQMTSFTGSGARGHDDRVDALVYAVSELLLSEQKPVAASRPFTWA